MMIVLIPIDWKLGVLCFSRSGLGGERRLGFEVVNWVSVVRVARQIRKGELPRLRKIKFRYLVHRYIDYAILVQLLDRQHVAPASDEV